MLNTSAPNRPTQVAIAEPTEAAEPVRPRLPGPDGVRAVATLGVVAIHAVHWPAASTPLDRGFWSAADTISRFAVPVFVVLSGALLQLGYGQRPRGGDFLRRRLFRSVVPWLVWAPIYSVTGLALTGDIPNAGAYLTWWGYGTGHLWFLLLIPQLYLVFAVWPRRRLWLWAVIALAVQAILDTLRLVLPLDVNALPAELSLAHGFQLFPYWIGYFALGMAAADWFGRPHRPAAVWILGSGAALIASGTLLVGFDWSFAAHGDWNTGTGEFLNPLLIPFVISSTVFVTAVATPLLRGRRRAAAWAQRISHWSLGIYIVHPLVLNLVTGPPEGPLLQRGLPVSVPAFLLLLIATFAASALLTRLIEATPVSIIVGTPRRPLRADAPRSRVIPPT